jgi:hypothetical protein
VVEADLAEIFGGAKISPQFEMSFREAVKVGQSIPLSHGCEIELQSGPGPTLSNALRDQRYLATAIQLSLLSWTHTRKQIASMLASSMRKRYELKVPGASPDPGYEGIMGTLAACSSQSSVFNWSHYTQEVQEKLRAGIPTFQYSADYIRMTPSLLFGVMHSLYMVQTLPEDRRIVVSNEIGSITLIVWAHYVLGLNVIITGKVSVPIAFGNISNPQVTIEWTKENAELAGELFYPSESKDPGPEIRLLDPELTVLLKCFPDDESRETIQADDRHPLLGWGNVYLQRLLNTSLLTSENDPIYEESVKFITALALQASERLDRAMWTIGNSSTRPVRYIALEYWRVFNAAQVIFHGIKIDRTAVDSYVDFLRVTTLNEESCPNAFDGFLGRVKIGSSTFSPSYRLLKQVKYLAQIVLTFAHVTDIKACAEMPVRLTADHHFLRTVMTELCNAPNARATVEAEDIFHAVALLLSNGVADPRDDTPGYSSRETHFLFLWSDFGWSIFLDTVDPLGEKDPASVRPEFVHAKRGTPTNVKTNERKFLLRDGTAFAKVRYPASYPIFTGATYVPRCAAKVMRRRELWTSCRREFESALYFSVQPSREWCGHKMESWYRDSGSGGSSEMVSAFEDSSGYRQMQARLWRTYSTPDDICTHSTTDQGERSIKLGPDAAVLLGWTNPLEFIRPLPQRILIFLTRGDRHIRWLAVMHHYSDKERYEPEDYEPRELMLRTLKCCEECALKHVAALPGRWVLVL